MDGPEEKPDITLQLLQDGADYPESAIGLVTLQDGTTTYTWDRLPRFKVWDEDPKKRVEFEYSFKEVAEPDFPYEAQMSEDGLTLTNRYVPPLFDLVAKKHWVDGAAAHRHPAPMLLSRQLQDGPVEEVAEAYTVTPDTPGHAEYTYTWANLPTTDINGNPYTYTVNEASAIGGLVIVGGYVYEVGEPVTDENGVTHITNTFQQPFDAIYAAKFWVGGEAGDHQAVTLELYRQFEDNGQLELVEGVAAPLISGEAPAFIYTWENLPLTDINARPYLYTVVETGAQDGIVTVDGRRYQVIMDGRAVVNEFIPPLADVVATKRWVSGVAEEDHTPPRMLLYRSLPEEEAPVPGEAPPVLDEGGGIVPAEDPGSAPPEDRGPVLVEAEYTLAGSAPEFTYTWHQLPQTDENARPYTYTVVEDEVDDDNHLLVNGRHYVVSQEGMAITNTYLSPDTNVVAVKAWVNGPEADHQPAQLTLTRRVADGPAETLEQAPLVSGMAPEFTYTWDGLPARDMQAREYIYAVSEAGEEDGRVLINGNTYAVETLVDELGCTRITNTYVPPERAVLNLAARKAMAGDPMDITAGQFSFALAGGGLELAATNDASGLVAFPQFAVEKAGEYRFTLKETKGSQEGMAYDGAEYTALVQVSLDPEPNTLAYTLTWQKDGAAYAQAQPVFTNTYTKPAPPDPDPDPVYDPINVPISGQKRAVNFALEAGRFQFAVKDHAGNTMETVSHDASGLISFSPLRIRRPGIYLYHITEVAGSSGIEYDATRYTVRVEVSAQGTKLSAAVSILKDGTPTAGGITFENRAILPATGDSYLWLPLALLASSLLLFIIRRRMLKQK